MSEFLKALALRHYRGIGSEWQRMQDFKKFNFFIGANNAGKSTVLNFISRHLGKSEVDAASIDPLERHAGTGAGSIEMALGLPANSLQQKLRQGMSDKTPQTAELLGRVLTAIAPESFVWLGGALPGPQKWQLMFAPGPGEIRGVLSHGEWSTLWQSLTGQQQGNIDQHWVPESLERIERACSVALPETRLIPAIRQVGVTGTQFGDYSGTGLIDRLAQFQSPDHDRREDRRIFDRINEFLREVTGSPEAEIEVPYNREHVLVHMNGRVLPLRSLGTGIEEVVMIAAFCTISSRDIVCVEEPEIHLHPVLQRKLVRYLDEMTANQYFIATHSASFIDTPGAAIFHVRLEDGNTHIEEALLDHHRHAICMDLGYRASDLVQSNCIIWVEGPSDRIYLKHWLRAYDDTLREGVHYSIMFYGGRLLSHLSADDEEVDDFIRLRPLNRHLAIVIDSDKASAQAKLNSTKRRVIQEFAGDHGVAWVTKGREIENYVDPARLQEAVASVYGDVYGEPVSSDPYDHALYFKRATPKRSKRPIEAADPIERNVDKVKVARAVCSREADLSILDLQSRISQLVALIRTANG